MLLFVTLSNWNLLDSFNRHFHIWFEDEGCCSTYDVQYWHHLLLSNFELANFLHSLYLKILVHLIYLQLIKALVCLFHFMRSLYRICMPWPQVMFSVCCYFAFFFIWGYSPFTIPITNILFLIHGGSNKMWRIWFVNSFDFWCSYPQGSLQM